ncbi:10482_t:CDS:2, partial [Ambispora gerdemannii]
NVKRADDSETSIQSSYVVQTTMPKTLPTIIPSKQNTGPSTNLGSTTYETVVTFTTGDSSTPSNSDFTPSIPNKAGSELKIFWSAMCFLALFGIFGGINLIY